MKGCALKIAARVGAGGSILPYNCNDRPCRECPRGSAWREQQRANEHMRSNMPASDVVRPMERHDHEHLAGHIDGWRIE